MATRNPTLDAWLHLAVTERKSGCRACGKPLLNSSRFRNYDHSDGWLVDGHASPQWLYLECTVCGYQNSFAKLGIERT
jgi:ribosomal protein L37E